MGIHLAKLWASQGGRWGDFRLQGGELTNYLENTWYLKDTGYTTAENFSSTTISLCTAFYR